MASVLTKSHLFRIFRRRMNKLGVFLCTSSERGIPYPFHDIPHKKGFPLIGNSVEILNNLDKLHTFVLERHKTLGPVFREKMLFFDMVYFSSEEALEQLWKHEGQYPQRQCLVPWVQYAIDSGEARGIAISNGEEWYRVRRVLNRYLLKSSFVEQYTSSFNEVARDFLDKLARARTDDNRILRINNELFHWALESMSTLLYGRRLGCLSDDPDPELEQFIVAVFGMFSATGKVLYYPAWFSKTFLPSKWNEFKSTFDSLFRTVKKYIDEKAGEGLSKASHKEADFMASLLSEPTMTKRDVYTSAVELMAGSVDTTSNVVQMILYELSRNPDVQQTLHDEVTGVVPQGELPSAAHLQNMPYLKAVVKETLRLNPIVPHVVRDLPKDIVVMGYHIPAQTTVIVPLYAIGRLPSLFEDPESFRPERWLRSNLKEGQPTRMKPYLAFGRGSRMCIGRRVAELQMYLLLAQLVSRYRIEPVTMEPVVLKTELTIMPSEPVNIKLIDRK